MCPACIASTAAMIAGAVSTGGILAVCIGKFRRFFRMRGPGSVGRLRGNNFAQPEVERLKTQMGWGTRKS